MYTKNFVIDNSGKAEVIKNLSAISPYIHRSIFTQAFIIKSVHLCDLSGFMITPDESNTIRISNLQGQQQEECLHAIISAVHKITEKQIISVRTFTSDLEQLDQIVKLTMDVSTYL